MAQVTSGRVVYSRTVQPAQYESKRAEVELSFILDDNEDEAEAIRGVGRTARVECLRLVGVRVREG